MKYRAKYLPVFVRGFLFLSLITAIVQSIVWFTSNRLVEHFSANTFQAIEITFTLSVGGIFIIFIALSFVTRNYLRNRIDFVRHSMIDSVTGQERLRKLPPDDFGPLSIEIANAIDKLKSRLGTLEQETDQLATLLSSMAEAVVMTNEHERVLVANPRALELFDLAKPRLDDPNALDWEGKRLSELTSYRNITDIASDVLWNDTPRVDEIIYQDEERGDTYFYSVSTSPIRNNDGHAVGVVIVLYDVTRLRRLERVRRDFVANVSHELRTPIASIKSSVETILLPEMGLPDVAVSFSRAIQRNANRMESIVEDLLTLSRLEAEGESRTETKVYLPNIFAEVFDRCAAPAKAAGLTLDIELPDDIEPVTAEDRALCQVLFNLVENAIKYNKKGGTIRLDALRNGNEIMIQVTDNGPGIPKNHLPRIFERFYRVDEGRSRDIGGTGLGLAIVKHNVRMMGGRIGVTSEPGETTFTVHLKVFGSAESIGDDTPTKLRPLTPLRNANL